MAIQDRLGVINKNKSGGANITTDARNKLVQRKRENIKDARERLGELTKEHGDVRNKLNQNRKKQKGPVPLLSKKIEFGPAIYKNLSAGLKNKLISHVEANRLANQKRTNQQRPLPRTKTSIGSGSITRTVSAVSKNRVGRVAPDVRPYNAVRANRAPAPAPAPARRAPVQRITTRKPEPVVVREKQRPRVPVKEQRTRMTAVSRPNPWASKTQVIREQPVMRQKRVLVENPQTEYVVVDEWDSPVRVTNGMSRQRATYEVEDNYEYVPVAPKKASLSQTIVSRLDDKPQMNFAQGYKILVCNLHQTVSLEDVEELFGNIGPLSSVQMIGTGMAEIVFLKKEDAYKAIEVYHYRLLDGQPMNVSVVSSSTKRATSVQQPQQQHQQQQRSAKMVYAAPPPQNQFYSNNQSSVMQSRPVTKSVLRSASGSTSRYNVSRPRPAIFNSGGFY